MLVGPMVGIDMVLFQVLMLGGGILLKRVENNGARVGANSS
jgi:hypothetical protein